MSSVTIPIAAVEMKTHCYCLTTFLTDYYTCTFLAVAVLSLFYHVGNMCDHFELRNLLLYEFNNYLLLRPSNMFVFTLYMYSHFQGHICHQIFHHYPNGGLLDNATMTSEHVAHTVTQTFDIKLELQSAFCVLCIIHEKQPQDFFRF